MKTFEITMEGHVSVQVEAETRADAHDLADDMQADSRDLHPLVRSRVPLPPSGERFGDVEVFVSPGAQYGLTEIE